MSVSEAIVCLANEKKNREASNPANQLSQFLSLAAQANVPVDQNLLLSVAAANANQYGQQVYAPSYPHSQQFQGQFQQQIQFPMQGQYIPNGNFAYQQQPHGQHQMSQMNPQQQHMNANNPAQQNISGILNAFSQNQSLLNNLNLLQQQKK